jgi:hypothetical protein
VADFGVFANQAHSDWLQWAAEGGLPFVLAIGTLLTWSLRSAVRTVWGLGAVSVFLHALVDYPFSRPALASWTMVVLAMLAAHNRSKGVDPAQLRSKSVEKTMPRRSLSLQT